MNEEPFLAAIRAVIASLPDCCLARAPGRAEIEVAGPDAEEFLHRISATPLRGSPAGSGKDVVFLDGKGHVAATATAWRRTTGWVLDADPACRPLLKAHLERFHIREHLEIRDTGESLEKLWLFGLEAGELLRGLSPDVESLLESPASAPFFEREIDLVAPLQTCEARQAAGSVNLEGRRDSKGWIRLIHSKVIPIFMLVLPRKYAGGILGTLRGLGAVPVNEDRWEFVRILAGRWVFGQDVDSSRLGPELTDDERILSSTKGCYPGQELVARVKSRGHVNWRLYGIAFPADWKIEPGREILAEGKPVARVASVARLPDAPVGVGLAYLRWSGDGPNRFLEINDGPMGVYPLPFPLDRG